MDRSGKLLCFTEHEHSQIRGTYARLPSTICHDKMSSLLLEIFQSSSRQGDDALAGLAMECGLLWETKPPSISTTRTYTSPFKRWTSEELWPTLSAAVSNPHN